MNSLIQFYRLLGSDAILLPIALGRKGPTFKGWQKTTLDRSLEADHQSSLEAAIRRGGNIGVLLTGSRVAIDIDKDELIEQFLELNPRLRNTLTSKGKRGCQIWITVEGERPPGGKIKNGSEVGEWRCDGVQSVIYGKHPDATESGDEIRY